MHLVREAHPLPFLRACNGGRLDGTGKIRIAGVIIRHDQRAAAGRAPGNAAGFDISGCSVATSCTIS
jgi:hypothetical protein